MPHTIRNIQSPYSENNFWANWESSTPRIALFVKVTPKTIWGGGAAAVGFTSNTRNMSMPGHSIIFKSAPAITPSAVEISLDEPGNLELTGIFGADSFSEADILAGKWNFAELEVFLACWDNVDLGEFVAHRGYLGETKTMQKFFTAESRGPLALLSQEIAKVTSRLCRALPFKSPECGHAATTVTIDGTNYNISHTLTVSAVTNNFEIVFAKLAGGANNVPNSFFRSGKITALGATANGGVSREIRTNTTGSSSVTISLRRRFPFPVTVGQQFMVQAGCDGTIDDCIKYENIINRRAEDWTPTVEAVNRVPSAA